MSRKPPAPPPPLVPPANPLYEASKPRVSKCGRFVELDGGKVSEMAVLHEVLSPPRGK